MDMKKRDFLAAGLGIGAGIAASAALAPAAAQEGRRNAPVNTGTQPSSVDLNYKPRRLNKCIELWEDGQPIYYTGPGTGPGIDPYEQGKKMAKTYADAICYDMEHNALDFTALREFMRGIVDGGPTRSGHRFPAVFVSTPIIGLSEAYMYANSWVFSQLLDCGIMGIHLCHARDTKAVQVCAQACVRFPFDYPNTPKLPIEGLRGSPPGYAAHVWGMGLNKYLHLADTWPLNPKGELFFGIKIEDVHADKNAEATLAVKGITMAEWGPGDHNYSLNGLKYLPEDDSYKGELAALPNMVKVRQRVVDLCKKNKLQFLNAGRAADNSIDSIIQQIKDGATVIEGNEECAIKGREYTKRKMPV